MKPQPKEQRITRVSVGWVVGCFVMGALISLTGILGQKHPDAWWDEACVVLILTYGVCWVWFTEIYQRMLDERLRIRNAEASRITLFWLMAFGLMYSAAKPMLDLQPLQVEPSILMGAAMTLYLLVYFILWLRSR